jgi:hypothetical protein
MLKAVCVESMLLSIYKTKDMPILSLSLSLSLHTHTHTFSLYPSPPIPHHSPLNVPSLSRMCFHEPFNHERHLELHELRMMMLSLALALSIHNKLILRMIVFTDRFLSLY